MPGRADLAQFADEAAGPDDSFFGASDDELLGVLRAWDRVEAHAAARKFAAVAELMRRRPAPGKVLEGPARMPAECDEFTVCELVTTLALSRWDADDMMSFAYDLAVRLPGTRAAFLDGRINQERAEIIARATAVLTPEESRAAEALVLGRAAPADPQRTSVRDRPRRDRGGAGQGPQTPRGSRQTSPGGAVGGGIGERRAGRAGTAPGPGAGRRPEDHRVGQAAEKAGLEGSMDELRARAYLDMLLGTDFGPPAPGPARTPRVTRAARMRRPEPGSPGGGGPGSGGVEGSDPAPATGASAPEPAARPCAAARLIPAGFAGRVNLIVPLATLLDLADRPGEIPGIGPIDPWLARDLARAAAQNPRTTWCVTVTDQDGHAIGHGCARPEPKNHRSHREKHGKPGHRTDATRRARPEPGTGRRSPSRPSASTARRVQAATAAYGTWRLATGASGRSRTAGPAGHARPDRHRRM